MELLELELATIEARMAYDGFDPIDISEALHTFIIENDAMELAEQL